MPRLLLVCPAAAVNSANQLARQLDPDPDCGDTFTAPLSANGLDPATYYWASPQVTSETRLTIQSMSTAIPGSTVLDWDIEADPAYPNTVLASLGLQRIVPPMPG